MAVNPKGNIEKLERILHAWNTLAPNDEFGGMTRQQFEVFVEAGRSIRATIANLEEQLRDAVTLRDSSDEIALEKAQLVKNSVLGHPAKGPNCSLYESMGYIRKDDRKSGLTRRKYLANKNS